EAAGSVVVPVSLSAAALHPVTAWLRVEPDSDTASLLDLGAIPESVVFAPGQTQASVTIPILDDLVAEDEERFRISVDHADNAVVGGAGEATLTLQDNDAVTVGFDAGSYQLREGAGVAQVVVRLSREAQRAVSVRVRSQDGAAVAGQDYAGGNELLTFFPGETVKSVPVALVDDDFIEGTETVTRRLS